MPRFVTDGLPEPERERNEPEQSANALGRARHGRLRQLRRITGKLVTRRRRSAQEQLRSGLGSRLVVTLVLFHALILFVTCLFIGPWRLSVPEFREAWAQPGPVGLSLFAIFAITTLLLVHLAALELLLPLWRAQRPRGAHVVSIAAALALLAAVGILLARMSEYHLNELWYAWAQIDEPVDTRGMWLARIAETREGEPGRRSVVLRLVVETGDRVEVEVLDQELWGVVDRPWRLFGGVPAHRWTRSSAPLAEAPIDPNTLAVIEEGSTLFSGQRLWRFVGFLPVDDLRLFIRSHCSGSWAEGCAEALDPGNSREHRGSSIR